MEKLDSGVCFFCQIFDFGEWVSEGFIPNPKGLRKGDPSSLFLFVIIGEALSRMLSLVMGANLISSFRIALRVPLVSHLQFADDTIIFCEANEE